ncbi:MAG: protease complex subunit PrcB family protein, partial [Proteobacteria bacterium]|nr:protease complex subunit PrcB family protein [Pseudomonadota bacterium]
MVGCGTSTRLIRRGGPSLAEARARRMDGPQARLALVQVTSRAKGAGQLICQGLGDMLTTALFQTGRFIVLERRRLGPVLAEQNFGRSPRVNPETAAPMGKLEGAELLMMVKVARFSRRQLTLGGALVGAVSVIGSILARLAVRDNRLPIFGVAYLTSTIWLDVKVVDARTGRILLAGRVEGLGRDWGGGALVTIPQLPLVLGHFNKTAMGRAIAEAVTLAAGFVAKKAPRRFFHARAGSPLSGQMLPVHPLRVFGARGSAALGRTIIIARDQSTLATLLVQMGALPGRGAGGWADFSREMVAVVFSGAKPTAGHGVWVERVVNEPREIVVYARETIPPPGIKVRTVTTYPAAVVRMPRLDK